VLLILPRERVAMHNATLC